MEENIFIDKESLCNLETRFYGYAFINSVVVTSAESYIDMLRNESYQGCYLLISREDDFIRIYLDCNAYAGLYYYSDKDYFAISNSYLYLCEMVKKNRNHRLTVNKHAANSFLVADMSFLSIDKTVVNEIETVNMHEYLEIDIKSCKLRKCKKKILEKSNSVKIDSINGIEIIDDWINRWESIIYNLYNGNAIIDLDVTGGIDSRLILALFLHSGIDINKINVISYLDKTHTHGEDYEIAQKLANKYNFQIKNEQRLELESDMRAAIESTWYSKLGTHKQLYYNFGKPSELRYRFTGAGGEKLRRYWNCVPEGFKNYEKYKANKFYLSYYSEINNSIDTVYDESLYFVKTRHNLNENSESIGSFFWNDIADNRHFGRIAEQDYKENTVNMQPLSDPELGKLQIINPDLDRNLLVAVIYTRLVPDILDIKFDSGHVIDAEIIEYAKIINSNYPFESDKKLQVSGERKRCDSSVAQFKPLWKQNDITELIKNAFYTDEMLDYIKTNYNKGLYYDIIGAMESVKYFPLSFVYPFMFYSYIENKGYKDTFYNYVDFLSKKTFRHNEISEIAGKLADQVSDLKDMKQRDDFIMALYSRWIRNPRVVIDYIEKHQYKSIGIYGAGRIGKDISGSLLAGGYVVSFVMDKNPQKEIENCKVIGPYDDVPQCDVIIITVASGQEQVKAMLSEKVDVDIVQISDIVI